MPSISCAHGSTDIARTRTEGLSPEHASDVRAQVDRTKCIGGRTFTTEK